MKIHKRGKEKAEKYAGFGQYVMISAPLCAGAKGLWKGNSYLISMKWKDVTCKKCLKVRPEQKITKVQC